LVVVVWDDPKPNRLKPTVLDVVVDVVVELPVDIESEEPSSVLWPYVT
jgi:hypothetical protein